MNDDDNEDDTDTTIDRADFSLPEGRFSVTGARNGKLSLCIGIAIIIISMGAAISNILDSWGSK